MKRLFALLLILLLLLAGCQKTPETPAIMQKDMEQMIEKAHNDETLEDDLLDVEHYGIPKRFNFAQSGADGKLIIEVNAEVVVPDYLMPIVRVEAAQFSQDTVSALYDAFLGDTPMIETIDILTKSKIEAMLVYYQKVLADESADPADKDFAEQYIQELTAKYETAPESIQTTPATDELKYQTETFDGHATVHYYGVNIVSEDKMHGFQVRNDRDNEQAIEWIDYNKDGKPSGSTIIPVSRGASIWYSHYVTRPNYTLNDESLRLNRDDELPEYAQSSLKLTPEEAASAAEHMLDKAGLGDTMAIAEIRLVNDKSPINGVYEATNYAYDIKCQRVIQGVPCAYTGVILDSGDVYAPSWHYEDCNFEINDMGIISFYWSAPMQIKETVVERASLLHFSEIEDIIKKMLPIVYEPEAREAYNENTKLTVDSMTLSLTRIAEQNAFDSAMLVPAWNVYGLYTRTGNDGYSYSERRSLLTINAIDGSIIDPAKGY